MAKVERHNVVQKRARRRQRSRGRRAIRTTSVLAVLALAAGGAIYLWGPEPAADVGQPAPPFALPDATGQTVSLAEFLGKEPVVLVFYMFAR